MSSDGSIELVWGDGLNRFKFGIGQFRELQERINERRVKIGAPIVGPMALMSELRASNAWPDDLRDVFRIGLVGAGMSIKEAHALLTTHFDRGPFAELAVAAFAILAAGWLGPPGEEKADQEPAKHGDAEKPIEFGKLYGAGAAMGFAPAQVDGASFYQFGHAVEGFRVANGGDTTKPPSDAEFDALLKEHGVALH